jgi:hypothetical protein
VAESVTVKLALRKQQQRERERERENGHHAAQHLFQNKNNCLCKHSKKDNPSRPLTPFLGKPLHDYRVPATAAASAAAAAAATLFFFWSY